MFHYVSCGAWKICEFFASFNLTYCCCVCVCQFSSAIMVYFRRCVSSRPRAFLLVFISKKTKWNDMNKNAQKKTRLSEKLGNENNENKKIEQWKNKLWNKKIKTETKYENEKNIYVCSRPAYIFKNMIYNNLNQIRKFWFCGRCFFIIFLWLVLKNNPFFLVLFQFNPVWVYLVKMINVLLFSLPPISSS